MAAWLVSRHATLKRLLADDRVSKDPRNWPAYTAGDISRDWPLITFVAKRSMFTTDGEEHQRLRSIVGTAFTPRRIEALRPRVERITDDLLTALAARDDTPVDLREGLAYPLPIEVICSLYGVAGAMRDSVRRAVDGIFDTGASPEQARQADLELWTTLHQLVADKRENPGEDMTTDLLAARDENGNRLTDAELCDTLALVLGAGHETTSSLIDHAVTGLLSHPEQRALVREGLRSWDEVLDEALRWQAPIATLPLRFALADIELADGTTIPAGDPILAGYAGAGRDHREHGQEADEFDITRERKNHLAFGYGPHYCLGAPLARLEARTALIALFERFPEMALAVRPEELVPTRSLISNDYQRVPVTLGPPAGSRRVGTG